MKKSRRMLALFLGAVMCLTILAACNKTETPSAATTPGAASPAASNSPSAAPSQGSSTNQGTAPSQSVPDNQGTNTVPGRIDEPGEDIADKVSIFFTFEPPPAGANLVEDVRIIMGSQPVGALNLFIPATNNTETLQAITMIFDRLISINRERDFIPELAASFSTEDYQTYSFTLRDDVYFHDGGKLTASDVAWTIEQAQNAMGTPPFDLWRLVENVNVIDDLNFELTLENVNVDFLFNLTRPMSSIVSEKAMRSDPNNGFMIGTGAWIVSEFVSGDYVNMRRNDDWWDIANKPILSKTFHYRFVPEQGVRAIMVLNGDFHLALSPAEQDVDTFLHDPNYQVIPSPMNNPQCLGFNLNDPLMADKNFRLAVIHGIDRDEAALIAAGDWAVGDTQYGHIWGLNTEFRNKDLPAYTYDPELAKEYLAKSSYKGEEVEIATAIITNINAAEVIQSQLADIGIKVRINSMDSPSFQSYAGWGNTNAQMWIQSTQMTVSAASARSAFVSGGSGNRYNFVNAEVASLFDQAAITFDRNERAALYQRIQEIIYEEAIGTNIFWRIGSFIGTEKLHGYVAHGSEGDRNDFRQVYVIAD